MKGSKTTVSRKLSMDKKQKYITIVMTLLLVVSVIVERYFLDFNYILMFKTIGVFAGLSLIVSIFTKHYWLFPFFSGVSIGGILMGLACVFFIKAFYVVVWCLGSLSIMFFNECFELNISFDLSPIVDPLLKFSNIYVPCYCLSVIFYVALCIIFSERNRWPKRLDYKASNYKKHPPR